MDDLEKTGGQRRPPWWTWGELHWIGFRNEHVYLSRARGRWSFLQWIRSGRGRF